ncbi:hypothetical protein [Saccharopolyspora gloriosae]|uniref:hypothetical protein n=1 Tax=Saccharopolyspora gloriosae TaxID=455344 RepID=UPI001FB65A37|nr:hypothetical protein [Saccharopolyspora gloriosae]
MSVSDATAAGRLEARFDAAFVARLALREKQIQQNYRPIISIHKWFARRPGSVFRSLLISEFGEGELSEEYTRPQDVPGVIADPFMGGGTTVFEAARMGLSVVGSDVNPMAYWTVRQAVAPIDLERFSVEAKRVVSDIHDQVSELYETQCAGCAGVAEVKYFHHVKTCGCPQCGREVELFPGLRLAEAVRHTHEVYHCPNCNVLREIENSGESRTCPECDYDLKTRPATRGTATCGNCDHRFKFSVQLESPPRHRLFGIEYHCAACYPTTKGRQFKTPDSADHDRLERASSLLREMRETLLIPEGEIPDGDETGRLHRWGYSRWRELFNDRQLLGLGLLMNRIEKVESDESRYALATVFSDFLRYQNLLCRYDTYALKCQDIFSVHGFPVGLIACENNILGIPGVGSGAFVHFVEKYKKAKQYAQHPHETVYNGKKKSVIPMEGESIEAPLVDREPQGRPQAAWLASNPSQDLALRAESLDGVFTDPPYFANVQYAELMDFCYVWLRKFMRGRSQFEPSSTCTDHDLTGNVTKKRGLQEFASGLSSVFQRMSFALKPAAPLVFTYHHNDSEAYAPLVVAILDAGLTCTSVLPAPGEMSASLHIAGTKSSILDSVFVCRKADHQTHAGEPFADVARLVEEDVVSMQRAGYQPTGGDRDCLTAGHIAGSVVRDLVHEWNADQIMEDRFELAKDRLVKARTVVESA